MIKNANYELGSILRVLLELLKITTCNNNYNKLRNNLADMFGLSIIISCLLLRNIGDKETGGLQERETKRGMGVNFYSSNLKRSIGALQTLTIPQ